MSASKLFVAAAVLAASATVASAQTVGIATGPQATPTNTTGSAIAKVVNESAGLQTRAVPHTSNDISMPLVNRGQIDMGIASVDLAHTAVHGEEQFKGRALPDLRVVAKLYPLNVGIIVRKDSSIRTASDLKGKRYPSDFTSQKGVVKIAEALLANAGLSYKDVNPVPVPNTSRGNEDFVQGKSDSAMLALGAARLQQTDAQVGIRILPLDTSAEGLARMHKFMPVAYPYELKPGVMPGVEKSTHVMAYDLMLVASTKTDEKTVYETVKAMHKGKNQMVAVSPVLRDFEPSKMYWKYATLQYHPGALKYYKEAGLGMSGS